MRIPYRNICILLSVLLAVNIQAKAIEPSEGEYRKIKGYDVQCFSSGELTAMERLNKKHKPYNFCQPQAVDLVLNTAKKIKGSNFYDNQKIMKITPYNQKNYALIAILDEKEKRIYVENIMIFVPLYQNDSKINKTLNNTIGTLYSDKNSNMYCFKNPQLGYTYLSNYGVFVAGTAEKSQKYKCFNSIKDGDGEHMTYSEGLSPEYHFWGGLVSKKDG